jgi:uncharacterized membrane protein
MEDTTQRKLLAATFATSDGGSRGAKAVAGGLRGKIGNTAVLTVRPDGSPHFTESKDWGAGRGALLGGAIGLLGGPAWVIAGGAIGGLAAKLRDSGFKDAELEQLGRSLKPNGSAVVIEIAADATETATDLLKPLGAERIVVEEIDASVATLFEGEVEPQPEPEAAAMPSEFPKSA